MLILAWPWALALLIVPILIRRFAPAHEETQPALRVPFLHRVSLGPDQRSDGAVVLQPSRAQKILGPLLFACSVLALARPQWVGPPITRTVPSRDLLLAVDLSGSMETTDFTDAAGEQVDRLTAVKQVLDEFLTRREGDRVGLIFFGTAAFVQAPFTDDLDVCRVLLDEAQVRMAGPQTALGDAVGLAISVFDRSDLEERVLIVLTDGNDTGSTVPPDKAAQVARDKEIRIYTVAVGDPEAVGEEKLDEETLETMADETDGRYFHANDREALAGIYDELDKLETREVSQLSHRPTTDLFFWPLGCLLIASLCFHGITAAIQLKKNAVPEAGTAIAAALIVTVLPGATAVSGMTFHFLRPLWLIALVPAGALLWLLRRDGTTERAWRNIIAPHLLPYLMLRPPATRRLRPWHLLGVVWFATTLAVAGPTWRREPSPFADDEAAIVVALKVTPTMLAEDVRPSRLERAVHKIKDLLALRPGARAALIAYSGSAHRVMPLTTDHEIISTFATSLQPDVMPVEGDDPIAALTLGNEQLIEAGRPGSIVLLLDSLPSNTDEQFKQLNLSAPVHLLAVAADDTASVPAGSPPAPPLDRSTLQTSAAALSAEVVEVTADDTDVQTLSRQITRSLVAAENDGGQRWREAGYWITPFIVVCCAVWFRRGWLVQWT